MRKTILAAMFLTLAACTSVPADEPIFTEPVYGAADVSVFPRDRTLVHAEDGVILPDGSLLVGDMQTVLARVMPDGTKTAFGKFADAGFEPGPHYSPNGISMEADGRHVLIADVVGGVIYRADTRTGDVTVAYDHPYAVNSVVADSTGAIWFTQPTESTNDERMWAAVNRPMGDGALFRLAPGADRAVKVAGGLDYANGIALDERRGTLYASETVGDAVYAYPMDTAAGTLGERRLLATVPAPDNLEMGADGMVWAVSPGANKVVTIDPDTGRVTTMFDPTPDLAASVMAEWSRRKAAGLDLMPAFPAEGFPGSPGLLTGVILPPDGRGPIYISNLGDALLRIER